MFLRRMSKYLLRHVRDELCDCLLSKLILNIFLYFELTFNPLMYQHTTTQLGQCKKVEF